MPTVLDRIRSIFVSGETWPPPDLRARWEEIERFDAFRRSDEGVLRMLESKGWWERYLISPVPRLISRASANLLFGEPPEIETEADADGPRMEYVTVENELDAELQRAAMIASSEGEVWGRICFRPDLIDVPVIEFVSRRRVIPHFAGRFVVGATFVTEWPIGSVEVVRLFEHYESGAIRSELYRGTRTSLGIPINLDSYGPTAGTSEVVLTGFDKPLVAFIPNTIDSDPECGYSDYAGLEERFLAINRAATIGDSNTELAGKKRALLDAEYAQNGNVLTSDEVFIRHDQQGDLSEHSPVEVMEFGYDASQITTWLDHLIDSTLAFGGASPQLVGRQLDGAALSGTALRLKLIHSLIESSGKGRYFDRGVKRLLHFAAVLDSRPTMEIGFGRKWAKPDAPPDVTRQDGLPRDDLEAATYIATLVGAEAISIEERVAFLHPDWPEERQREEVEKLTGEAEKSQIPVLPIPPRATPGPPEPQPGLDPAQLPA